MTRTAELVELTRIRVLAFLRVPEAVFWVFVFPMVLAFVLGLAFRTSEPPTSRVGVIPLEGLASVEERLAAEPHLEVVRFEEQGAANRALFAGKVDALVLGLEPTELRLDPARQEAELARLRLQIALAEAPPAGPSIQAVTEKGSRYVDFLFPGLLGMNLMGTGIWAIAFAVADLRQKKVLKRLLVTPMRRSSFLASLGLARLAFLVFEGGALTAFGFWVLDIPMRGGWLAYIFLCLLGATVFAGVGLLAASRARTIEGASGMINLVMMPMWLGSGVFFSYEKFPAVLHPLLKALPLTALNDSLRRTMLEGAGLVGVLPEIAVMVAWMVLSFVVALWIFRWE